MQKNVKKERTGQKESEKSGKTKKERKNMLKKLRGEYTNLVGYSFNWNFLLENIFKKFLRSSTF